VPLVDLLEQVVQGQGHENKTGHAEELARDAETKSVSEAEMLVAVAVAFPWTISLPGTYPMVKKPSIDVSTYSRPATLPGLLVEVIRPRRVNSASDTT
jgi:hypothetical protein